MTDFRSIVHGERDRFPLLWVDTDFSPTDMLAIYAASLQEDFELVGFSDNGKAFTEEVYRRLEEMDYVTPIASTVDAYEHLLDSEGPDHLIVLASEDTAGLDFLILGDPQNLVDAFGYEDEVGENMDTVIISLGRAMERGEDLLKTVTSFGNPEAYQELERIGHQRLLLEACDHYRIEVDERISLGIGSVLEKLGYQPDEHYSLDSLLALFLYIEPQAFIFEEVSMHVHTQKEERGYIHFTEGKDFLLVNQINVDQFEAWLRKIFL